MRSRFAVLVSLVLALALVAAACSSDDSGEDTTTTAATEAEATTTTAAPAETTTTAAAVTTTAAAADDAIELVIWADEKRAPVLQELAPQVLEETGVQLVIELIDNEELREQVTTAAPAGEGPDIFIGAHDWTGEMAATGISAPIDLGGRDNEWFPVSIEAFNFDGQLYAVPYATEAIANYYTMDLVPEAPETLADLTAACDALPDIANCWGIPGGGDASDAYHNYPFVSVDGGYIFGWDATSGYDVTDVGLDSEGAIAGVTTLETLVTDGYVGDVNGDDAKNLFLDGSEPFFLSGPWQLNDFDEAGINYGVAKIPTVDGAIPGPFVGAQGWFVNAFSDNTGVAESFLLDYIATEEVMTALYEADPRNPAFQATFVVISEGNETAKVFALSAADGVPMPNIPEMGSVWTPLSDQLLGLRNGATDAATAMTTAADQVRTALE